jgi:acyl-CoA thioesterase FadM
MATVAEDRALSVLDARPRFEGSNICTWIGFKHVMYLVEEAVLDHLRQSGLTPRRLFEEHGLGVEIVDSHARIMHALHMDDVVRCEVRPLPASAGGELGFRVTVHADRAQPVKAVSATVRVLLRRAAGAPPPPADLAPHTVDEIVRGTAAAESGADELGLAPEPAPDDVSRALLGAGNGIVWRWRIPYFYCHFSDRIQHSGYLRLMEEVVDIFLRERGISIRTMLDRQSWIPVVPSARVEILREGLMEEDVYTVFRVTDVFKETTYTAVMDCYVWRGGRAVHIATGTITHGYAVILDRRDWKLVSFDPPVLDALHGRGVSRQQVVPSTGASAITR